MAESLVVEFVGLAGSGKTFLARAVSEGLKQRGLPICSSVMDKSLLFSLGNLPLVGACLHWVLSTRPRSWSTVLKLLYVWYKSQIHLSRARAVPGIHLIEEGYLHKFRSIRRGSKIDGLQLSDVLNRSFSVPDMVVIVQSDAESVIERRRLRDHVVLDFESVHFAATEGMARSVEDATTLQMLHPQLKTITVYNDRGSDVNELVRNIIDAIVSYGRSRGVTGNE